MWETVPNTNEEYEWNIQEKKIRRVSDGKELIPGYTHRGEAFVLKIGNKFNVIPLSKMVYKEHKQLTPKKYRDRCNSIAKKYKKKGLDVDHIIPVSFCREVGLTPEQCSSRHNIQLLTKEENYEKFTFVDYDSLAEVFSSLSIPLDKIPISFVNEWNKQQEVKFKSFFPHKD